MSWRKQESPLPHAPGPSWVPLLTGEAVTAERLTRQAHSALISYPCMSDPTIVGRGWVPFLPISAPPPHPLPMWELWLPTLLGALLKGAKWPWCPNVTALPTCPPPSCPSLQPMGPLHCTVSPRWTLLHTSAVSLLLTGGGSTPHPYPSLSWGPPTLAGSPPGMVFLNGSPR